jgi:hypothetical protein
LREDTSRIQLIGQGSKIPRTSKQPLLPEKEVTHGPELTFADVLKRLASESFDGRSKVTRNEKLAANLWDAALGTGDAGGEPVAWAQRLVVELIHGKPAQVVATDDSVGGNLRALAAVREATKRDIDALTMASNKREDVVVGEHGGVRGGTDKDF